MANEELVLAGLKLPFVLRPQRCWFTELIAMAHNVFD